MSLRPPVALPAVILRHCRYYGKENIVLKIFKEHAELNGEKIPLYEAACIMAKALIPMNKALHVEDGYTHYDLAMSLKYNVIDVEIDGYTEEEW